MRVLIVSVGAAMAGLWLGVPVAQPGEICIKCTEPAQTYRCSVAGEDVPADLRRQGFYCASRIAEQEDHGTCAVVRKQKQCPGEPRRYVYDADAPVPQALAPRQDGDDTQPDSAPKKKEGPPGTVAELTRETARQTGETLEQAADETVETTRSVGERVSDAIQDAAGAVGKAARDTVTCIGSLFDDC